MASDGGIFSYGDAPFSGSTGALRLNEPVVGMAAAPDGGGYWLVAPTAASSPTAARPTRARWAGRRCPRPVVGHGRHAAGGGYWLVLGSGAAGGQGRRHRPRPQRPERQRPGLHRPARVQRHRRTSRATRRARRPTSGYTEAAVQLQRGHRPASRPGGRGRHGRDDPHRQRRRRARASRTGRPSSTTRRTNVAVDIHADGGPPGGSGFTVLEPVADGPERRRDRVLGHVRVRCCATRSSAGTGMPVSRLRRRRRRPGSPATTWPG